MEPSQNGRILGGLSELVVDRRWARWVSGSSASIKATASAGEPVFDEALLARLRLTGKRLVFLTECLADLAERRVVQVWRGDPVEVMGGIRVATTYAPVPGWHRRSRVIELGEVHPWPWLVRPHGGPAGSFTSWRQAAGLGQRRPTTRRTERQS